MSIDVQTGEFTRERLEELASDPRNIVMNPRPDKTMDILPSSTMSRIIHRTRCLFQHMRKNGTHETIEATRLAMCAAHPDARTCRTNYPRIFIALTSDHLPARPLQGIRMMIRAFQALEAGILSSEEEALQFFFVAILPHSFPAGPIQRRLASVDLSGASDADKLVHKYLMDSLAQVGDTDERDGFMVDVAAAERLERAKSMRVRCARAAGAPPASESKERQ